MAVYKNFINGRWQASDSGETFTSINPANRKSIGRFQQGTAEDVKAAIDAAENAYQSWSDVPAPKRGAILYGAAGLLRKHKESLARLVTQEMGKVLPEARGDVQEAIDMFEYTAAEGRRLYGYTTPSELHDKFCMTIRRPVGVVGIITPWNFPIAIPAWKIAPALLCGNTCVFKPASDTPLCAIKFVELLAKAGLPKGVVNLVTGSGDVIGGEIITNSGVRMVSFTGSKATGEHITQHAGVKKIGLELGGKNAILIMDDADLELALEGVIWGGFGTTGQRCTAASRVIVHHKIKEKFQRMLLAKTRALRLGDGLQPSTDIGPLINQHAVDKSEHYVGIGQEEGARLLIGGESPKMHGFFFRPTVFDRVEEDMRIAQEEIFGPVLSLITVHSIDEAIDVCNNVEYGLSSSIYTSDMRKAFLAVQHIEAGLTYVNSSTIGSEVHLPFGGVKGTGNGTREAGIEGINEFSETKTVYVDYSGRLQKAQME